MRRCGRRTLAKLAAPCPHRTMLIAAQASLVQPGARHNLQVALSSQQISIPVSIDQRLVWRPLTPPLLQGVRGRFFQKKEAFPAPGHDRSACFSAGSPTPSVGSATLCEKR